MHHLALPLLMAATITIACGEPAVSPDGGNAASGGGGSQGEAGAANGGESTQGGTSGEGGSGGISVEPPPSCDRFDPASLFVRLEVGDAEPIELVGGDGGLPTATVDGGGECAATTTIASPGSDVPNAPTIGFVTSLSDAGTANGTGSYYELGTGADTLSGSITIDVMGMVGELVEGSFTGATSDGTAAHGSFSVCRREGVPPCP